MPRNSDEFLGIPFRYKPLTGFSICPFGARYIFDSIYLSGAGGLYPIESNRPAKLFVMFGGFAAGRCLLRQDERTGRS